jgi:hypothetical protein
VDYLAAVVAFATGGTFNPSVTSKLSGAVGLIQFLPSTAKSLGTTTKALRHMGAVEQLDYVQRHLALYKGRLSTLEDVYMAILWPKAIGQTADYILFTKLFVEYSQNSALDLNSGGQITKAEAPMVIKAHLDGEREPRNQG